ncbi:DUF2239 family protein [Phenylobacterium sp.]|uniref:DUF2239 family protein n=1 Tax=Phenylobacterium sp. TaxID=1871053 RepID=UPI0035AE66AB
MDTTNSYTAWADGRQLATGDAGAVAAAASRAGRRGDQVLIFDDATGRAVELDPFADPPALALEPAPAAPPARQGRGRPRLGVVAREVTLLPRHWDWLAAQPGGASAALRRLVDQARRAGEGADRSRVAQEALYRVMSALGGDLPGFEEAARALYARDDARFDALVGAWPPDLRAYVARLAATERAARV